MPWAPMPKTPVDEHDNALMAKSKIRLSKQGLVSAPTSNSSLPKYFCEG